MAINKDSAGKSYVEALLKNKVAQVRLTAFRALIFAYPADQIKYSRELAADASPAVRREVAVNLRDTPYAQCKDIIKTIIAKYDGRNRFYLEALGTASKGKEVQVYNELVKPTLPKSYSEWNELHKKLAWRLRTPESLDDLIAVIQTQKPDIKEFRSYIMTFSLAYSPEEQKANLARVEKLKADKAFSGDAYQSTIYEVLDKDLIDKRAAKITSSFVFPKSYGPKSTLSSVKEIAALKGNIANGRIKSGICMTCHKIGDNGIPFGPNLSNWAQSRTVEVVVHNIVNPSDEIAHGYDKAVVVANKTHRIEGIQTGYSHHAGAIKVKTLGGQTLKIAFRKSGAKIEKLKKHSWMPSASDFGLNNQDVRDIVEYLKSL